MIASVGQAPPVVQFFGIYDPNWDERLRKDTPLTTFTRINIAFGKIIQLQDQHFSIEIDGSLDRVKELIGRVKSVNPNSEIFLSVGGDNGPTSFGGAAKDKEFSLKVLQFLSDNGFNGFDIDWEEGLQKDLLNRLTIGLRDSFRSNGYQVTLDGWSDSDPEYDLQVLQKTLNQINIMSYGCNCDLASCVNTYTSGGFPITQLNGAIESEYDYEDGVDTLGPDGSIYAKAEFAVENKMGMINWTESNDSANKEHPNFPRYLRGTQLWENMNTPVKIGKTVEKVKQMAPAIRCKSHRQTGIFRSTVIRT